MSHDKQNMNTATSSEPQPLSVSLSPTGRGHIWKGKMDEYSYEEGSGLELLHVSDVLDYLGNFPQFSVMFGKLKLLPDGDLYYSFVLHIYNIAGVSEPQMRAIVRHSLLHPKTPAVTLTNDNFHILLGAGAVVLVVLFFALVTCVLYHKRK